MSLTSRDATSEILLAISGTPGLTPNTLTAAAMSTILGVNDIWMGNLLQPVKTYLDTAETMDISSDSAADTLLGAGARQLLIIGLDNNFGLIQEVVDLNGLATVVTANSYLRINSATVISSGLHGGTGVGANDGVITITSTSTANLEGVISSISAIPLGSMFNSHFTVPEGFKGVIRPKIDVSIDANQSADVYFMNRRNNVDLTSAPFGSTTVAGFFTNIEGTTEISVNTPPSFPPRTDMWFAASPSQNNTPLQINYNVVLLRLDQ